MGSSSGGLYFVYTITIVFLLIINFKVGNILSQKQIRLRSILVGCSALLGIVNMFHSDDYIPLFVSFFDIPVSLDNLFQRIASIYDRF